MKLYGHKRARSVASAVLEIQSDGPGRNHGARSFRHRFQCIAVACFEVGRHRHGNSGRNAFDDRQHLGAADPLTIGIAERIGNGSITQQMDVLNQVGPGFKVLSGDDAFTFPLMALGGVGVISVVSNEAPGPMSRLARFLLEGRYEEARKLHFQLLPLMEANFIESNPIPVKAVLAMMGLIEEVYRLPLVPMKPENRTRLERVAEALGLLKSQAVQTSNA